jgi:hypothetical protein
MGLWLAFSGRIDLFLLSQKEGAVVQGAGVGGQGSFTPAVRNTVAEFGYDLLTMTTAHWLLRHS